MRLIDADALYERACNLEAQALDYVGKLIERDDDEPSNEWRVWSAILTERTAFKHDVFDAPTIEPERKTGEWLVQYNPETGWYRVTCPECEEDVTANIPLIGFFPNCKPLWDFCPYCGADNRGDKE